jgi:hypothetical protein
VDSIVAAYFELYCVAEFQACLKGVEAPRAFALSPQGEAQVRKEEKSGSRVFWSNHIRPKDI